MFRSALLSAAFAVMAASPAFAGSDAPRLHATAGLGGLGKAGRWTPVRVVVEAPNEDVTGQLVIEWGHARVRREVVLAAPSRKAYDIYIQSGDVRDEITVRLFADGRELRTVRTPIRIASIEEPITVCIDEGGGDGAVDCSATLVADDLPRSWRGYDAADAVVWRVRGEDDLDADQKRALGLWRAMRQSDIVSGPAAAGALPADTWPPAPLARDVAFYVLTLGIAAAGLRAVRANTSLMCATVAALAAVGSVAATASGTHGAVVLRYAATVEQFAAAGDAFTTVRASVESPSAGRLALRTTGVDGAIEVSPSSQSALEGGFDVDGNATVGGRLGRGSSAAFTLEASGRLGPFAVATGGGTMRVSNISDRWLYACEFPSAFPQDVRELRPGTSIESRDRFDDGDPIVTCRTAAPPVVFLEPNHPVKPQGETIAVLHLRAEAAQ